jgi:hypothetical protein
MSDQSGSKNSAKNTTGKPEKKRTRKTSREPLPTGVLKDAASEKSTEQIKKERQKKNKSKKEDSGCKNDAILYTLSGQFTLTKSKVETDGKVINRTSEFVVDGDGQMFVKSALEFFEDEERRGVIFLSAQQAELLCKMLGICEVNSVCDYEEKKT